MEVDVAVLGGGPGGYTAAIRGAQLGATVACIEKEPELGGTCLRVGCIPTKAWVQTAQFLHLANETFGKLGVSVSGTQLDFAAANEWKAGVVKQMTGGVAGLFKANGVEWVKGAGKFKEVAAIARDLQGHKGTCVVIAGDQQSPRVHALAHAMNQALGNAGKTVSYTDPIEGNPVDQQASLAELVADLPPTAAEYIASDGVVETGAREVDQAELPAGGIGLGHLIALEEDVVRRVEAGKHLGDEGIHGS